MSNNFSFWKTYREQLGFAVLVIGSVLYVQPSRPITLFILGVVALWLIFVAVLCVVAQLESERVKRERQRRWGEKPDSRWTVCFTIIVVIGAFGWIGSVVYLKQLRDQTPTVISASPPSVQQPR